jgi:hypothetical protein
MRAKWHGADDASYKPLLPLQVEQAVDRFWRRVDQALAVWILFCIVAGIVGYAVRP